MKNALLLHHATDCSQEADKVRRAKVTVQPVTLLTEWIRPMPERLDRSAAANVLDDNRHSSLCVVAYRYKGSNVA